MKSQGSQIRPPKVVVPGEDEDFVGEVRTLIKVRMPLEKLFAIARETENADLLAAVAKAAMTKRKRGRQPTRLIDRADYRRNLHIVFEVARLTRDGFKPLADVHGYVADAFGIDESRVANICRKFPEDVSPELDAYVAVLIQRGKIKAPK